MAPRSIKSTSTVKTVDDVFSQLDIDLPNAGLDESRRYIRKLTGTNNKLESEAIEQLQDPSMHLSPIAPDPIALLKLMSKYKVALGGIQATAFFYQICDITSAPWDFFCHNATGDEFIQGFLQITLCKTLEDLRGSDGNRVVYLRKSINGLLNPANIRIYISDAQPMSSILNLKLSYEQACLFASGAIFFWPKLQQKGLYREFESNNGLKAYPKGKTIQKIEIDSLRKTSLKKPLQSPFIHTGIVDRVESVIFSNSNQISKSETQKEVKMLQNIVYAVFNSSTKYLDSTCNMS